MKAKSKKLKNDAGMKCLGSTVMFGINSIEF